MHIDRKMGLAAIFVCAAATTAYSRSGVSPRSAYELRVQQLERIFDTHSQDAFELRSLYTADAVLVEADGNRIVGRNQIVDDFRSILKSGAVSRFRVVTTTFRTDGRLSYAGGVEEIDERDKGSVRHVRHRFLDVLKRGPDGAWRFEYILEAAA